MQGTICLSFDDCFGWMDGNLIEFNSGSQTTSGRGRCSDQGEKVGHSRGGQRDPVISRLAPTNLKMATAFLLQKANRTSATFNVRFEQDAE